MYQATINNSFSLSFSKEASLSELISKSGLLITQPCGGKQICGKCRVIASGSLSPLSEKEQSVLTEEEIQKGFRLACVAKATGNVFITVEEAPMLVELDFSLEQYPLSYDFQDGLVIDIGTTTVAAILYQDKKPVKIITEANAQASYGSDVITRIAAANTHPGALEHLIKNQIKGIISACSYPKNIVIVANTAMLHFLTEQNVLNLGIAPYQTADLFGKTYRLFDTECYLAPCISAFVGGDITAGILATRMTQSSHTAMLVDLGTNGEIAYFDGNTLCTASTAAGPAFEGAGILMGMPAKPGAINQVLLKNGNITYTTVGNTKAIGICGSGIIDTLAVMKQTGVLEESGALVTEHPLCSLDFHGKPCFRIPQTDVILTREDIRTLQLAKGAIHAGMLTMANEIDTLYLSGGFGSKIDVDNAELIGLLPKNFAKKNVLSGNTALHGGVRALFSTEERRKLSWLAEYAQSVAFHHNPKFTEEYISKMSF